MATAVSSIRRARSLLLFVPRPHQIHSIWRVPTVVSSTFQIAQKCHAPVSRRNIELSYFGSTARKENDTDSQKVIAKPRSVPVQAAYKLLNSGHRYLDVRTRDEFVAGHTCGAINIPYMLQSEAGMLKNSRFLEEVSTQFVKDDKILVGCRSGKRSVLAAADLESAGYSQVVDVSGGLVAWTENGLPTEK